MSAAWETRVKGKRIYPRPGVHQRPAAAPPVAHEFDPNAAPWADEIVAGKVIVAGSQNHPLSGGPKVVRRSTAADRRFTEGQNFIDHAERDAARRSP